MKIIENFGVDLGPTDMPIVTAHQNGSVSLHGTDDERSFSVNLRASHLPAIRKLAEALEKSAAKSNVALIGAFLYRENDGLFAVGSYDAAGARTEESVHPSEWAAWDRCKKLNMPF